MCGILGWLGDRDRVDFNRFGNALDLLAHRGPDDRGIHSEPGVLLGMRRLAIIDLTAAGHQPMIDTATGAVLVFNGEIYNHIELRKELATAGHVFVGHSDSEVLLHALAEWGEDALLRLNGMWAFAYWQPKQRHLLLARDRFGVKPLYFREGHEGFAFASEPKALLSLFPEHRMVAREVLLDFLVDNILPTGGESFYRGIRSLPPAHVAVYDEDDRTLRLRRYWEYPDNVVAGRSPGEAVDEFAALFEDSVRLRLRSDVPVGLTLSGGLDSSGVLAAAARNANAPLVCFTSVYGGGDVGELEWAQQAAAAVGAPLQPIAASADEWLPTMRKIAWHMDGPGGSPAVYPLWQLMKKARAAGVPVLLEGQGADEALAGYAQYAVIELLAVLSGRHRKELSDGGAVRRLRSLRGTFSLRWAAAWMLRESFPSLLVLHRRRSGFTSTLRDGLVLPQAARKVANHTAEPVRARLLDDHSDAVLPGLLQYGDAISMAHSIEARHPFMDYRLVEWMFRLPTRYKLHHGETKWVLREYLRAHGQAAIGNRRDKRGYPTPIRSWLAGKQGREAEQLLLNPGSPLHEWCDPEKIRRLFARNRVGAIGTEHHLYKLLAAQIWLNECIEGRQP